MPEMRITQRTQIPMRVLISQESSGVIRRAFAARGHFVVSVDLLPADDGNKAWGTSNYSQGWHYQGDIMDFIYGDAGCLMDAGFDLMIAHPECTYLCNSGVRWLYGGKGEIVDESRMAKFRDAAHHFVKLQKSPFGRIAIENPIPHRRTKQWTGNYTQLTQPWQFGDGETKATCLWLKNLPKLQPTNIVEGRTPRVHHASPGPNRWKERSRTLPGIAEAMADQWGSL